MADDNVWQQIDLGLEHPQWAGMTVWAATPEVSAAQHEQARAIVSALGHQLYVEDERFLDMATAISGSGPSYVFLLMEALIDAA